MRALLMVAVIVGLLMAPAAARAKATTIAVVGVERSVSVGAPERAWFSDGILHVRGQPAENEFIGTCGGESCTFRVPFVLNVNVNPATGNGTAWGTWEYVADGVDYAWGDRVGSFAGTFSGQIRAGVVSIRAVSEGTGDFAGMKLRATGLVPPPPETDHPIQGVVLDPHG